MILSPWTGKKKKSSQSKGDENDFNHCIWNWLEERERDQSQQTTVTYTEPESEV